MKKLFCILMLALSAAGPLVFGSEFVENDSRYIQFEKYLKEINEAYHIPGMAFILTDSEKTLYSRAYGQCTSLDQQFFIGSMSKSFTALCVMQLAEKELVNLEADISVYLPQYKFSKPVTVRMLLNHTSGFDTNDKLVDFKLSDSYGKYKYANVNYDLLGKIIEEVTGLSYEEYTEQNIFKPLGMTDTKANAQSLDNSPKLLKGNRNYLGFFKKGKASYPEEKSWFHEPAGYIASTPQDYGKYLRMYLNDGLTESGNQIIKKESIDSMWYENVSLGVPQYDAYYGMGWNLMNYEGQELVFHGGQVETGITYMFILPEEKLGVCFMLNGNDYLGMTSLMNNAVWASIAILKGEEPEKVNHVSYVLIHTGIDLLFVLMLALSIFILIKGIKGRSVRLPEGQSKVKLIFKISLNILGFLVWPVFLLTFTGLLLATPLWVVKAFVPDMYGIIIFCAAISAAGTLIKVIRMLKTFY